MTIDDVLHTAAGQVKTAIEVSQADEGASPVLVGVLREFERKVGKAHDAVEAAPGDDLVAWEAIVEAEQAGDSAKAAALAEPALSDLSRAAIMTAHDTLCGFKQASIPPKR